MRTWMAHATNKAGDALAFTIGASLMGWALMVMFGMDAFVLRSGGELVDVPKAILLRLAVGAAVTLAGCAFLHVAVCDGCDCCHA